MSAMILSIMWVILMPFFAIIYPFLPPEPPEVPHIPETVTITVEGVRYKNLFLDENLRFVEKHDFSGKEPDYATASSEYYKVENNWLYVKSEANEDYDLSEKLFCPEEDWEELKAYYSNPENYDYQYIESLYSESPNDSYLTVTDSEMFKKLLGDESDIRISGNDSTIRISDDKKQASFYLKRTSKNGLFYKCSAEFTVYESKVYHDGTHMGIYNETIIHKLKDEINEYISGLLKSNGYEALFE